jgi:hypothetical protein
MSAREMNEQDLLAEIKAAYKAQRLRPVRGFYYVKGKGYDSACPIVALAFARGIVSKADADLSTEDAALAALEWAAEQFGEDWVKGLLDGFDRQTERMTKRAYQDAYELGGKLADQILPGELPFGL